MLWGRWNPLDEMNALLHDVDRLYRRFLSEAGGTASPGAGTSGRLLPGLTSGIATSAFTPAIEAFQKDNRLVIRAELPGVDPQNVEVTVVGNELRISGERKQDQEIKRDNYYVSETSYGRFERAFTLPEGIKPEDVRASYRNGILEITLPAKGLAQAHRVKIEGVPETKKMEAKTT